MSHHHSFDPLVAPSSSTSSQYHIRPYNPFINHHRPTITYPMMIPEKTTMAIAGFFNAMPLLIIPLAIGMESYLCQNPSSFFLTLKLAGPSFRRNKVPDNIGSKRNQKVEPGHNGGRSKNGSIKASIRGGALTKDKELTKSLQACIHSRAASHRKRRSKIHKVHDL